MSRFLYIPPYLNWALFGSVSTGSPSLSDDDHDPDWLVDGRPGFPLRLAENQGPFTITNTAGPVDVIAICHHLLDESVVINITGGITDQIIMGPVPRNGVRLNRWRSVSSNPAVTSLTVTVEASPANSTDVLIGELVAGAVLELDPPMRVDGTQFLERQYVGSRGSDLSGIPPYTERARSSHLSGSQYYSQDMLDQILEWYDSQDGYAYPVPSLIIPDSDNPHDCRLVFLTLPAYTRAGPLGSDTEWLVTLELTEVPRTRW